MFFLPLDRRINDRVPFAIFILVALNLAVMIHTHFGFDESRIAAIFREWGATPANLQTPTWITHMFLHAGPAHVVGNMAFLILFGMNVERRLGAVVTLFLYFLSGFAALALFVAFNRTFAGPLVGASGAVSGIVGMYVVLFHRRTVEVFWFAIFVGGIIRLPALVVASLWIGLELLQAIVLNAQVMVAHWAHVGGFLGGFGVTPLVLQLWRGYPVTNAASGDAPPAPDRFEEKAYIPEGPAPRRERGLSVVARDWKPLIPAVRRIVDGVAPGSGAFSTPARIAGGLASPQADDLRSRLERAGVGAGVVSPRNELPEVPIVFLDRLELTADGIGGVDALGVRRRIESRRIARIQSGLLKGATPVLDVVVRDPWVRFRLSGVTGSTPYEKALEALKPFTPQDSGASFGSLPEMDEYFRWSLARAIGD